MYCEYPKLKIKRLTDRKKDKESYSPDLFNFNVFFRPCELLVFFSHGTAGFFSTTS